MTTETKSTSVQVANQQGYSSRIAIAKTLYRGLMAQELSNQGALGEEFYVRHRETLEFLSTTFEVSKEEILSYEHSRKITEPSPLTDNLSDQKGLTRILGGDGNCT